MRKFIFTIFLFLLILPEISLAGTPSETKWVSCCASNCDKTPGDSVTFGRTYCCTTSGWIEGSCPTCTRSNPTITITPSSQNGARGSTLTYTINVTNNDNFVCDPSTFSLTVTQCSSPLSCTLSSNSLTISPGSFATTTINVSSSPSASAGTYTFKVKATNTADTSKQAEASADYVILACSSDDDCPSTNPCKEGKCINSYCEYPNRPDGTDCPGNGYYCSGNCKREYRDYYCSSGSCVYSVTSTDYASSSCKVCRDGAWVDVTSSRYCSASGGNYYGCSVGSNSCNTSLVCVTGTTTTTTLPPCGNPSICEPGETQDTCSECRTVVNIIPSQAYPGQTVRVIVYFNDSRFDTTKPNYDVKIELRIDDQYWDPYYCPINDKKWRNDMGYTGTTNPDWTCSGKRCSKTHEGKEVAIITEKGYGYIEAQCVIPPGLMVGTHRLKATPTIYSNPITLRAAEAELKIGDGLYTFVLIVKAIFSRLTGFFVFRMI
ncbi:MAG: Ig domain-containing protein [Candidatus Aenigmatarchaeota archaeon]